ncbi:hypothetical protein CI610_02713 [invertebrate metagenome]|uniref:Transposase n=1 Tax=invertebrate metagenome TaxID=1711999 RepID=A0A2H9T557_9ZZZZ
MSKKRKQYSAAFKAKIALAAIKGGSNYRSDQCPVSDSSHYGQ